jgi:hypothetical protein
VAAKKGRGPHDRHRCLEDRRPRPGSPDRADRPPLTGPDGQSLVAPAGAYRVTFEPNSNTLVFVDGEIRFSMPRGLAEACKQADLISGRLPNDNPAA